MDNTQVLHNETVANQRNPAHYQGAESCDNGYETGDSCVADIYVNDAEEDELVDTLVVKLRLSSGILDNLKGLQTTLENEADQIERKGPLSDSPNCYESKQAAPEDDIRFSQPPLSQIVSSNHQNETVASRSRNNDAILAKRQREAFRRLKTNDQKLTMKFREENRPTRVPPTIDTRSHLLKPTKQCTNKCTSKPDPLNVSQKPKAEPLDPIKEAWLREMSTAPRRRTRSPLNGANVKAKVQRGAFLSSRDEALAALGKKSTKSSRARLKGLQLYCKEQHSLAPENGSPGLYTEGNKTVPLQSSTPSSASVPAKDTAKQRHQIQTPTKLISTVTEGSAAWGSTWGVREETSGVWVGPHSNDPTTNRPNSSYSVMSTKSKDIMKNSAKPSLEEHTREWSKLAFEERKESAQPKRSPSPIPVPFHGFADRFETIKNTIDLNRKVEEDEASDLIALVASLPNGFREKVEAMITNLPQTMYTSRHHEGKEKLDPAARTWGGIETIQEHHDLHAFNRHCETNTQPPRNQRLVQSRPYREEANQKHVKRLRVARETELAKAAAEKRRLVATNWTPESTVPKPFSLSFTSRQTKSRSSCDEKPGAQSKRGDRTRGGAQRYKRKTRKPMPKVVPHCTSSDSNSQPSQNSAEGLDTTSKYSVSSVVPSSPCGNHNSPKEVESPLQLYHLRNSSTAERSSLFSNSRMSTSDGWLPNGSYYRNSAKECSLAFTTIDPGGSIMKGEIFAEREGMAHEQLGLSALLDAGQPPLLKSKKDIDVFLSLD